MPLAVRLSVGLDRSSCAETLDMTTLYNLDDWPTRAFAAVYPTDCAGWICSVALVERYEGEVTGGTAHSPPLGGNHELTARRSAAARSALVTLAD